MTIKSPSHKSIQQGCFTNARITKKDNPYFFYFLDFHPGDIIRLRKPKIRRLRKYQQGKHKTSNTFEKKMKSARQLELVLGASGCLLRKSVEKCDCCVYLNRRAFHSCSSRAIRWKRLHTVPTVSNSFACKNSKIWKTTCKGHLCEL